MRHISTECYNIGMKIGVFDSGNGSKYIASKLKKIIKSGVAWSVINDKKHVPYGEKDKETIIELTDTAIQPLIQDCPIIVIACNTATTAAISTLRRRYPDNKFVGIEPMLKPAALGTKTSHITVLATPFTLKSERYLALKNLYIADNITVDEPDTVGWPKLIDQGLASEIDFSSIKKSVKNGSDTIVIACTHYLGIIDRLSSELPGINILEPSEAIARQISRLQSEILNR